jgi:hypothetical protein
MLFPAWPPQRVLQRCLLIGCTCAILGLPGDASARIETLRWEQADLTNVAGFNVYVRTPSGQYGLPIDVGMATLEGGNIYAYDLQTRGFTDMYVGVRAYSAIGRQSVLSNELFLRGDSPGILPAILGIILD